MRVGIIGFGGAGRVHFEAWKHVPGAAVVALSDIAVAPADTNPAGVDFYANPMAMFEQAELDAVTICTPPDSHAALAIAALQRGLPVMCEKPLAITPIDAPSMLQAAARYQAPLQLATKFRHVSALQRARDLLRSGAIGEPVWFEIAFTSKVDMSGRWNSRRARSGGGVIIDNGCHAFDIVSFLFGSVSRVQAVCLKPLQALAVEDSATISVQAADGVIGRIDLSWSLPGGRDAYVVITGSEGTIEVGWRHMRIKTPGRDWEVVADPYDKIEAHSRMNAAFADAVNGQRGGWISPVDCLRTVAAVDAAYRSIASETWEDLDLRGWRERRTGT